MNIFTLIEKRINSNIVTKIKRFNVETNSFKLFEFQEFANFLKRKNVIHALIIVDIISAIFEKQLIDVV